MRVNIAMMCAVGAVVSSTANAGTAEISWATATGGTFSAPAPWAGGIPPGASDGAIFSVNGGYVVDLFTDVEAGYVAIDGSSPVFDFAGGRLDLTFIGNAPVALSLGRTMGSSSSLLHTDGEVVGDTTYIAEATGTTAGVTVAGSSTRLATLARLDVGHAGSGTLDVFAGALVESGLAFIGALAGADGMVRVSGAGSRFESGLVVVGGEGTGELRIQSGGVVVSTGVRVGDTGGSGSVVLSGPGSELDATGADVKIGDDGEGTFTFSSGVLRARDLIFGIDEGEGVGTMTSGSFSISRDFVVGDGGTADVTLSGSHGTLCQRLRVGTGSTSQGTVHIDSGLVATVQVDIAPGTFSIGELNLGDDGVVSSPLIRLFSNGLITGSGQLTGFVESSGLVMPDGVLTVIGDYTQAGLIGDGALDVEIGGMASGLSVSGTATLTGLLRLTVADGFTPSMSESFTVVSAGAVVGNFTSLDLPGPEWMVEIVGNDVIATFTGGGDPADLDGDGSVGSGDLAMLLASWGACPGCAADFDGDGSVGASDLAVLLAAWG